MIEAEIETLKCQLNNAIDRGFDYAEIYELSVRLDKLIVQYYIEKGCAMAIRVN
ncbi:MAG: aspartyl-phosphate phosphatase Spo0E family protein [Clostridia bacterium]|nr:aspartyl-phosphate phosphatase Spo0E family protein [Clostridia bacterium]